MKKLLLVLTLIVACLISAHSEEKKVLSVTIKTKKGPLSGILTIPPIEKDEKIPVVILCHGFMGNKETPLMQTLVDSLCNSGMATVCFDFDGHGDSYGKQQDMTVPRQIDDVLGVFSFASRFPYASKFAIVGHSQGGVAAIMAAAELGESVSAVALIAPAAVLRDDALRGIIMGTQYNPLSPPRTIALKDNAYTIGRNYITSAQDLPIYEKARTYKGKTLIIHGKNDVVVPYTYSQRFDEVMEDSKLELIEKQDHAFTKNEKIPAHLITRFLVETLK